MPRLLGWPLADLDAATRKTLEVALHAGSSGALALVAWRRRRRGAWGEGRDTRAIAREAGLLALTFAPPALAGLLLERPIEQRLGGIRAVAGAQIAAGAALWLADRRDGERQQPGAVDHLAVGVAQAAALAPGVSRSGAALTAARLRGLSRPAALGLSLRAALPVTLGAAALKGVRAVHGELKPELRAPLAAGALAALATGLGATGLVEKLERARSLRLLAAYRVALGGVALAREHRR